MYLLTIYIYWPNRLLYLFLTNLSLYSINKQPSSLFVYLFVTDLSTYLNLYRPIRAILLVLLTVNFYNCCLSFLIYFLLHIIRSNYLYHYFYYLSPPIYCIDLLSNLQSSPISDSINICTSRHLSTVFSLPPPLPLPISGAHMTQIL